MKTGKNSDLLLDATGEECPVPLQLAADRLETMAPGQVLRVRSTDPVAPIDFEAWCMRGPHEYLGSQERNEVWEIAIRKGSA